MGLLELGSRFRRFARPLQHLALLGWIGGHRQRLLEKRNGLVVGAECHRAVGGSPERDSSLGGQGVGLRPGGRIGMRSEVMPGQRARQLVRAQRLEVASRGEMAGLAIRAGQGVVRHLTNEGLDERVLAALRRTRIDRLHQELSTNEVAEPRLELGGIETGHGREPVQRERLTQDGGVVDQPAVG